MASSSDLLPIILSATLAPLAVVAAAALSVFLSGKQRHKERQEDWKRQDDVAQKADDAVKAQAASAAQAAKKAEEVARQTAEAATLLAQRQDETAAAARLLIDKQAQQAAEQANQAVKAAADARLLLESNDRIARATADSADATTDLLNKTNNKIDITKATVDVVHTLVNSKMTAEMESNLDAVKRLLAMMHEVADLHKAAGHDPTPEALADIEATTTRVEKLATDLAHRREQQDTATAQILATPEAGIPARIEAATGPPTDQQGDTA